MRLEEVLPERDVKAISVQMTFEKYTTAFNRPHIYLHESATAGILCPLAEGGTRSRLVMDEF